MMVKIGPDDLSKLAQIVREETGNQVIEKNFSMLESRLRTHILKLSITSMSEYWSHFKRNEVSERSALQSLMTTHYTFFFREYVHFEELESWIEKEISTLKARFEKTKQPVRVWSAACSRGQEVYSLAIFLEINLHRKHGLPFEVVGTDIDADSVAYGKNAVYPIKEVNTIPQNFLKGFWLKGTGGVSEFAAVHPSVKSKTSFDVANLLELDRWKNNAKFDIIFCRNVFIYFSEENVKKIALSLSQRLDNRGLFVSGISEPLRFTDWDLSAVGPSCYSRAAVKTEGLAPAKNASVTQTAVKTVATPARYRVLCVDDSKTIQTMMKGIFSQDPNCERIDFALNGREAREKLDAGRYDLITLDIHMPEVSGIEFLERMYAQKTDPPVLMVSSVNRKDLELATRSIALGAFDYVEKPAMNNLQKSADEILTKARLALRNGKLRQPSSAGSESFDHLVSQKIVVADASQCLRLVFSNYDSLHNLEMVLRGQKNEFRSPAMIVCWRGHDVGTGVEARMLEWTDRNVVAIRDLNRTFKPNHIYILKYEAALNLLPDLKVKSVSLQILDKGVFSVGRPPASMSLQLLLDESLLSNKAEFTRSSGLNVSDITPSTSFASLSAEFFAHLRKAAS